MSVTTRRGLLLGSLLLISGCSAPDATPVDSGEGAARFVLVSGNGQTGPAGGELPQPLVVRVLDAQNQPLPNRFVAFVVTHGAGSMFAGGGLSDQTGYVRDYWTLGKVAGDSQRVEARAVDSSGNKVVYGAFTATAVPGAAAAVKPNGIPLNGYSATVAYVVPDTFEVHLLDRFGNRLRRPGITVSWVPGGNGRVSAANTLTDTAGVARVFWAFSTTSGPQTLTASSAGATPLVFSGTANPGSAVTFGFNADSVQVTALQATVPLTAIVADKYGNPVPYTLGLLGYSPPQVVEVVNGNSFRSVTNGKRRVELTVSYALFAPRRDTAVINVEQVAASVVVASMPTSISVGGQLNMNGYFQIRDWNNVKLENYPPRTWTSSNPSVASVNAQGFVTALSPGTFKITLNIQGVVAESPTITVNP